MCGGWPFVRRRAHALSSHQPFESHHPPHLLSRLLQGTDINKYMSLLEETAIQEVRSRAWCMLPYPINDLHSNPVRPPPFLA